MGVGGVGSTRGDAVRWGGDYIGGVAVAGEEITGAEHLRALGGGEVGEVYLHPKFSYTVVPAKGSGGSATDFVTGLDNNKDKKKINQTDIVTGEFKALSDARWSDGEPYMKGGSCRVTIKYVGPSDMDEKKFDQYDDGCGMLNIQRDGVGTAEMESRRAYG